MPNHITNIIKINSLGKHTLADVRGALLNDGAMIDFNLVAKKPECLDDFNPHYGVIDAAKRALGLLELPDEGSSDPSSLINRLSIANNIRDMCKTLPEKDMPDLIRAISNYANCGYIYWYEWQLKHWGTKWNAYGQPENGHPEGATEFNFQIRVFFSWYNEGIRRVYHGCY